MILGGVEVNQKRNLETIPYYSLSHVRSKPIKMNDLCEKTSGAKTLCKAGKMSSF